MVLIYRKQVSGAHSIEELFANIKPYLIANNCEVIEYYTNGCKNLFQDIINLRKLNADVYHITGAVHYIGCFLPRNKTLLTIHDINYYCHKLKGIKKFIYRLVYLTFPFLIIKYFTTISTATKACLNKALFFSINIKIIPNCYHDNILRYVKKDFNAQNPKILLIGTTPHKNQHRVLEALKGISCELTIIGRLREQLTKQLAELNIKYTNYCDIAYEKVCQLYIESDMVVFTSTSEGFGVPILESQAVGRALVVSNIAPLNIVAAKNSASFVDPYSIDSIREGIQKVVSDANFRENIIKNGLENVKNYTSKSIADKYYNFYREIINHNVKA